MLLAGVVMLWATVATGVVNPPLPIDTVVAVSEPAWIALLPASIDTVLSGCETVTRSSSTCTTDVPSPSARRCCLL